MLEHSQSKASEPRPSVRADTRSDRTPNRYDCTETVISCHQQSRATPEPQALACANVRGHGRRKIKNNGATAATAATATAATAVTPVQSDRSCNDKLRRFLQAYWLRPENALWMTLRSDVLSTAPLQRPSADISCGDGIFTFLHLGGALDPEFDVFRSVTSLRDVHKHHADIFDHVDDTYQPTITRAPASRIDCGTDLKDSMLVKAKRLGCYERLLRHDSNQPFPVPADSFATTYCNSAYWVRDIDGFLGELCRITQPGGHVILHIKLDALRSFTLEKFRDKLGDRLLEILQRNRFTSWPSLADRSTWEKRFAAAGLRIVDATPFITATHAHLWDIGLRPIAPLLVRMTQAMDQETRGSIKRDWVNLFSELLEPLCKPDLDLTTHHAEPGEIQYVLAPGGSRRPAPSNPARTAACTGYRATD